MLDPFPSTIPFDCGFAGLDQKRHSARTFSQVPDGGAISIAKAGLVPKISFMESTRAILIRLTRLTDTSLIVHWFTEEHGLVKTVAKGALRPKSAFAGRLDLFFGGEIVFQRARRGELHALREVAILEWREGLRENYTATLLAAYCCQLLESAVEPEHPEPELHDLLRRALDHIAAQGPGLRAFHHFERELARLLGIARADRRADDSLLAAVRRLPASREELLERLRPPTDFRSSAGENHR